MTMQVLVHSYAAPFQTPPVAPPSPSTAAVGLTALSAAWSGLPTSWNSVAVACPSTNCSLRTSDPSCGRQGVVCMGGRVVAILLPNESGATQAAIHGKLPQGMQALSALQVLDMTANRLSGTLPQFLGDMTSLRSLALSYNSLVRTRQPRGRARGFGPGGVPQLRRALCA